MIFKWVVLIIFVFLVFWLLGLFQRKQKHSTNEPTETIENMVCCAYCGVHHPESESIVKNGRNFCCSEHYQLYLQSQSHHR